MTRTRLTKRKLEMLDPESDTPSGPAETLTAELSFKSAQESTLPPVSSTDDDDLTEVSSPARPTAVSKIKKQVEWLHEGLYCCGYACSQFWQITEIAQHCLQRLKRL